MKQNKNYFKDWGTGRIVRLILAVVLGITFYYDREYLFLFAGIILLVQAAFNISCPGGSCGTTYKSKDKPTMEFEKYEPKNKIMYSEFTLLQDQCLECNNIVLKKLGTLHGVFGVELHQTDGRIIVSHTDEVTYSEIEETLSLLGFFVRKPLEEIEKDEPSIWGCAL